MIRYLLNKFIAFSLLLALPIFCHANQRGRMHYRNDIRYDQSHWALKILTPTDPIFIARVISLGLPFVIKLNPTDARGYRTIISLEDADMPSTLNRTYTLQERLGLNAVLAVFQNIYEGLGLIAQVEILGNNAHTFHSETEEIEIGNHHEPSFLHGHVIGRGSPTLEYIVGAPLRGPIPGELFDLRSKKIPWESKELNLVRQALSQKLEARRLELESLGIFIKDLAIDACSSHLDRSK